MPSSPDDSSSAKAAEAPQSFAHHAWETIKTIVIALLIALVIRTFAFEPFSIPSGSMIPTLLIGDYLFVSKYTYGWSKHSFPWSLAPFDGRINESPPERGDVVVFKLPSDNRTDYIKRVIGLPGDVVQVKGGILHLNGAPVAREERGVSIDTGPLGTTRSATTYIETLPGGRQHLTMEYGDAWPEADTTRAFEVPEGHFFAMGDNRDNSRDSRFPEVGFVPFENIVGRAEVIFFSVDGRIWKFWQWPWTVRADRMFDSIE